MEKIYTTVKSELDNNKLIVTVPELGYKIHYKINHTVTVDPITKYKEDDYPDFITQIQLEFIKIEPLENAKTRSEITELLRKDIDELVIRGK